MALKYYFTGKATQILWELVKGWGAYGENIQEKWHNRKTGWCSTEEHFGDGNI